MRVLITEDLVDHDFITAHVAGTTTLGTDVQLATADQVITLNTDDLVIGQTYDFNVWTADSSGSDAVSVTVHIVEVGGVDVGTFVKPFLFQQDCQRIHFFTGGAAGVPDIDKGKRF